MSVVASSRSSAQQSFVCLQGIAWSTYMKLRDGQINGQPINGQPINGHPINGHPINGHVQMTYDRGTLYLMSPGRSHERVGEIIARMIIAFTEEKDIAMQSAGQTTMRREILQRGFEPDKSYYVQHEAVVRSRDQFDPEVDPPPDLTVEVDVTSLSHVRMPIYAAFGVPEVWRWREDDLTVHRLTGDHYETVADSLALPGFPFRLAVEMLDRRHEMSETRLVAEFRKRIEP